MKRFSGWPLSVLKSLALHSVLLTVLLLRWQGAPAPTPASPREPVEIIEAVAVDERQVEEELRRLEEKERARLAYQEKLKRQRLAEERRLRELQRKRREEKQRLQQLARQRRRQAEEEARRLAELKKRREEEKARLARLEKERREAERKRREEERRRKAEEAKRRKAAEEKRRREAAARKAEAARKKALEAKRREAARRRAEAEAQRQAALARQKAIDRQVARAIGKIRQQVERRWIRPASYRAGMSCTIRVRVIPGGEVVDARVVRSSGNPAFDRSAAVAVRKASPLPVPADPEVAARFREFSFVFKPEG